MGKNYEYYEITHPITGNIMWKIDDICLPLGGVDSLVEKFIQEHSHENYSLSIYDELTKIPVEINCTINDMPIIVREIYNTEKGTPMTFIGINSLSESYVVGMSLCRGRIVEAGCCYSYKDGKFIKELEII